MREMGAVMIDAAPGPYIGPLATGHGTLPLIALGLNPGHADPRFQGRGGALAGEDERLDDFSSCAMTKLYLRDPWRAVHGRNLYQVDVDAITAYESDRFPVARGRLCRVSGRCPAVWEHHLASLGASC